MLGQAFIKHFSKYGYSIWAPTSDAVDVTCYGEVREAVKNWQPHVVINLVALCDMEACERFPLSALKLHAHGSANVAFATARQGATYVYLSSACVFDGKRDAYSTVSLTNPISTYGQTKLMGENIARSVNKHVVLRTEWCFGGGRVDDKKFIGKIYRQIEKGEKKIQAVTDKYGSLSYLPDLALALEKLLEQGLLGTYHVSCKGAANRYEIATEFVRLLGRDVVVEGVPSSYFEDAAIYTAPRPKCEILINSDIPGFTPRHWKDALAEYAKEFSEE